MNQFLAVLRKTDLTWRYVYNLRSSLNYRLSSVQGLGPAEKYIVGALNTHGIAITSVESLLAGEPIVSELDSSVSAILANKKSEISGLKIGVAGRAEIGKKTFNLELLGDCPVFGSGDVFARFALHDSFLNIANAYFRMFTKLRYYNLWYTAATTSEARESQLWHFDREDNHILKVFLYLDDVDEGMGPFIYAPETHEKGQYRHIRPEYFDEGGVKRTTDEQMAAVYPRDKWKVCTGKKGTIIFADTRGYHKGGECRTKDRLMFTCMYTSPASESKQLIKFPDDLCLETLTKKQRRALGF